jgi:hypothetical protein
VAAFELAADAVRQTTGSFRARREAGTAFLGDVNGCRASAVVSGRLGGGAGARTTAARNPSWTCSASAWIRRVRAVVRHRLLPAHDRLEHVGLAADRGHATAVDRLG